jgi:hypothetical protein
MRGGEGIFNTNLVEEKATDAKPGIVVKQMPFSVLDFRHGSEVQNRLHCGF